MAENSKSTETLSDIEKKISSTFKMFDCLSNNTVDVREIGTIIYSLGRHPSQADIHAFIAEVEEDHLGYVHLDKFLPAMTKILLENKFLPDHEDRLLQAFEVLDKEKKGYLEPKELTNYMTQEGEPFTNEEMKEMLTAHADRKMNRVYYYKMISKYRP
ncbi:dynein regulatory complex protein 8 [Nematolebias whitei]|uniref:dynein regulatory complex protein 8 n=1 Tax=Nematolebias whitei TaxID=451745 RepID=UPI001897163D|nr:dynein regulatory complex protein 8 [Nematolebias whitei]